MSTRDGAQNVGGSIPAGGPRTAGSERADTERIAPGDNAFREPAIRAQTQSPAHWPFLFPETWLKLDVILLKEEGSQSERAALKRELERRRVELAIPA